MRALVSLVVVALVGFAVYAQSAAAGSSPPKNPGISVSVNVGSTSVSGDVSTDGDASVDVSTPSASAGATVDVSSPETPVSATTDASASVGGTGVETSASAGGASTGTPVQVRAKASTPASSASAQAGTKKGLDAYVRVETPVATASGQARTAAASTTAQAAAPAVPSNEGSPAIVARRADTAAAPAPRHAGQAKAHHDRIIPSSKPKVTLARALALPAPPASRKPVAMPLPGAKSGAGQASKPVPSTPVTASAWQAPGRGASSAPGSGGSALGSGLSAGGFFAILTFLLMLAAPLVGRWLRPAIGPTLQPAFASLPERPG
jgi:hypothetical protein